MVQETQRCRLEFIINCDESRKMEIAKQIHNQLHGKNDYIWNHVILDATEKGQVSLSVFEDAVEDISIAITI